MISASVAKRKPSRPGTFEALISFRSWSPRTSNSQIVAPPLADFFPEYPGVRLAVPADFSKKSGPAPKQGVDPDGTLFLPFVTLALHAEIVGAEGEFVVRVRLTEPATPLNRGKVNLVSDVAFRYTFDPEAGRYVGAKEE